MMESLFDEFGRRKKGKSVDQDTIRLSYGETLKEILITAKNNEKMLRVLLEQYDITPIYRGDNEDGGEG